MKKKVFQQVAQYLPLALTLIFVALVAIQAVNNADIWFHLRIGERIVNTKTFPKTDFLSHTAKGREWIIHSWGYGVLAYLIQQNLGLQALCILRAAIGVLMAAVILKTAQLKDSTPLAAAFTTCFTFYVISIAWIDRPHLLGSLFITVLMLILAKYQQGKKKPLYLIPPLLILWANTHASVPLAPILIIMLYLSNMLELMLKKNSPLPNEGKGLITIVGISILTALINPYHIHIYKYFFKINSIVTENIFEWLPLTQFFADPYVIAFLFFLGLHYLTLLIVRFIEPEKISYFEIALTLSLSYLAFSALRHMVIFSIIMAPYLAKNITVIGNNYLTAKTVKRVGFLLGCLLLILAMFVPGQKIIAGKWGLPKILLPVEAANFVKETNPQGNMYNHFNWGGYFLWKLYPRKTFVDGRLDMFVPDIYKEWLRVASNKPDWKQILEKYQVNWIIFPSEGIWEGLRNELEKENGKWCLVFYDDYAAVIVREEPNKELCSQYQYTAATPFNPHMPAKTENLPQAIQEYKRAIQNSQKNATAHNKLGSLYLLQGTETEAEIHFKQAIETNPTYATPYYNLGRLYQKEQTKKALEFFEQAISHNKKIAPAYRAAAILYGRRLGNKKKAIENLKKYIKYTKEPKEKEWAEQEIYRLENEIYPLSPP
ncbi:MAG: tetratricopeptide repeat protein [Patescibacteria group bacterium]